MAKYANILVFLPLGVGGVYFMGKYIMSMYKIAFYFLIILFAFIIKWEITHIKKYTV